MYSYVNTYSYLHTKGSKKKDIYSYMLFDTIGSRHTNLVPRVFHLGSGYTTLSGDTTLGRKLRWRKR